MKRKPRTVKMLACLACSMSGAAALLAWIEPEPGLGDPARLSAFVHELVEGSTEIDARVWHTVELVYDPVAAASRSALTATRGDDHHFRIDSDGSAAASQHWARQSGAGRSSAPGVIKIVVTGPNPGERLPEGQRRVLRALLRELNQSIAGRGDGLTVVVGRPPAQPGALDERAINLRQLLSTISHEP